MKPSIVPKLFISGLLLAAGVASALEAPQPKAGLWEVRARVLIDGKGGEKVGTMQQCMDAATMAASKLMNDEYNKKNCSKNETRKDGSKWIRSLICRVGDSTMSGQETREFIGDNAYHTESVSTYDPPFAGKTQKQMVVDGKWLGPCK